MSIRKHKAGAPLSRFRDFHFEPEGFLARVRAHPGLNRITVLNPTP